MITITFAAKMPTKTTSQIKRRAALAIAGALGGDQLTKLQRQFTAVSVDAAVKAGIHGVTIKTGGRGFISATPTSSRRSRVEGQARRPRLWVHLTFATFFPKVASPERKEKTRKFSRKLPVNSRAQNPDHSIAGI